MKKFIVVLLAVALTACASPVPTEQAVVAPPEATSTPVVVVQTVIVEATQVPTDVPSPTTVPPTEVPPTVAPVVVTVVVEATQPPAQPPAPTAETSGGLITVDNVLGAGWFVNMTRTGDNLSLRCQLYKEITFTVTPTSPDIKFVDFYYRTQDKSTGAVFEWQNVGRMIPDANGNFVLVFSGEDIKADFRKPTAWFDYQFIGSSSTGVVGRSERIVQQVNYSNDCP